MDSARGEAEEVGREDLEDWTVSPSLPWVMTERFNDVLILSQCHGYGGRCESEKPEPVIDRLRRSVASFFSSSVRSLTASMPSTGGVIVWDIQKAATERTYEFTLPPGAPGGGTYQDVVSLSLSRISDCAWLLTCVFLIRVSSKNDHRA